MRMELDASQKCRLSVAQKVAFLWRIQLHAPHKFFQPSTHPRIAFLVLKTQKNRKTLKKSFELYLFKWYTCREIWKT
jgi:hypothetical protein